MSKNNFWTFLEAFKTENNRFGDLARDAFHSASTWTDTTAKSLQKHMESCGACAEALSVLRELTQLYK